VTGIQRRQGGRMRRRRSAGSGLLHPNSQAGHSDGTPTKERNHALDRRFRYSLELAALLIAMASVPAFAQAPPQAVDPFGGGPQFGAPAVPGPEAGFFEGFEPPPMFQMPPMPEMAKKMSAIMVLRALHDMRFTAK